MELTQDNYGYEITFTVKKSTGVAEDLAGIQGVLFQVVDADTFRNVLNGACVVTNAAEGKCKYTVVAGNFAKAGNFQGSLQIQYTPTKRVNTKQFFITVNRKMASN